VDNFGGWRRNCNDQRKEKKGMNGMDSFVFFSR
jgi:hypothetical protein